MASLQFHIYIVLSLVKQLWFSYFEFRLGISFQKQKFLYLNSQPGVWSHNHYTKEPITRDTEKPLLAFNHD